MWAQCCDILPCAPYLCSYWHVLSSEDGKATGINDSCFTRSKPEYLQGMKPGTRMWAVYMRALFSMNHSAALALSLFSSVGDELMIKINIPVCHWNCQRLDNNSCPLIFLFFLNIQDDSLHCILPIFLQTRFSTVSAVKSYCIYHALLHVVFFPLQCTLTGSY